MEIKKGTSRIVFIFPRLGFVVKVARIYPRKGFRAIWPYIWTKKRTPYLREAVFSWTEDYLGSFRFWLFRGLRDNWMERSFYKSSPCRDFLQPTVFSLLGLANIQFYGGVFSEELFDSCLWGQILSLSECEVMDDDHHFSESRNFCVVDGSLRMVDYGSWPTRKLLLRWGEVFIREIRLPEMESKK